MKYQYFFLRLDKPVSAKKRKMYTAKINNWTREIRFMDSDLQPRIGSITLLGVYCNYWRILPSEDSRGWCNSMELFSTCSIESNDLCEQFCAGETIPIQIQMKPFSKCLVYYMYTCMYGVEEIARSLYTSESYWCKFVLPPICAIFCLHHLPPYVILEIVNFLQFMDCFSPKQKACSIFSVQRAIARVLTCREKKQRENRFALCNVQ